MNYVGQVGTLTRTFLTDSVGNNLAFETGNVTRLNARAASLSTADKTQIVSYAQAMRKYL